MQRKILYFFSTLFLFALISCQTTNWSEIDFSQDYIPPIKLRNATAYISKIDLNSVSLVLGINTQEFYSVSDFAEENDLDYAINSTPYYYDQNNQCQLLGLNKFNDQILSQAQEKYSALAFYFNEENQLRAKVIKNQSSEEIAKYPTLIGAYFTILQDNQIQEFKKYKRSRTACGLSSDGRFLYLLCVTSSLKTDLSGMTYQECAALLQELNCSDGLEFDGGHSSAMYCPEFGYICAKSTKNIPASIGFYRKSH
ncbi:MAG: phosphodiester glycosidase family protein [Treponema sp.]|nr:phosphodiester glycosidase family protein [Treponema sp.]